MPVLEVPSLKKSKRLSANTASAMFVPENTASLSRQRWCRGPDEATADAGSSKVICLALPGAWFLFCDQPYGKTHCLILGTFLSQVPRIFNRYSGNIPATFPFYDFWKTLIVFATNK